MNDLDFIKESGVWEEIGNPGCISRLIDMVRKDEREKAAKVCDDKHDYMCSRAAAAIRSMK